MDTVTNLFTNSTFLSSIPSVILLVIAAAFIISKLKVRIKTNHIQIGGEAKESFYERKIIQEQCDFAHEFLMGLVGKIKQVCPTHQLQYDGWFTRCILETMYDEVVHWITYNHVSDDEAYISTKQTKICAMLYTFDVLPEFKTPEFQERVKNWTKEIIQELVRIRKVYLKECMGAK